MNPVYKKLEMCYQSIRDKVPFTPKVALILGSGLGALADEVEQEAVIEYSDIDGFPISTVYGHKGRFVFAHMEGVPVVIMQGRVHYYEGYSITDVVLPIRLMGKMGAEILFLTNASGGINGDFQVGDFMLITDHISAFIPNPLIGQNIDELGVRFPDMSTVYKSHLNEVILKTADACKIPMQKGVYVQLTGPSYEAPAEIRMYQTLGADAVGMSTVCEAIAANHMGMNVCGISCITNMAAGISKNPLSHKEVQETGDRVAPLFKELVSKSIGAMGKTI